MKEDYINLQVHS